MQKTLTFGRILFTLLSLFFLFDLILNAVFQSGAQANFNPSLAGSQSASLIPSAISTGFDYPVGSTPTVTQQIDNDGWYNAQDFTVNNHLGEDWNAESGGNTDCGAPVYAASEGTIVYAQSASGWGRVLILRHDLPNGTQVETQYGHLESFSRTSGTVARREQIGTIGDGSGTNPPCHLHFELRFPNSASWGLPGPGYSSNRTGWTDPSNYIDANRNLATCNNTASTIQNFVGGPPIHPPGSVIKSATNSTVYLIDSEGRKRAITSGSVLAQLYNQATDARTGTNFTNDVITVTQGELDLYEQGGNISAAFQETVSHSLMVSSSRITGNTQL